jgi:hypothetical protein
MSKLHLMLTVMQRGSRCTSSKNLMTRERRCSDLQLEHPLVTLLYDSVISDGNWAEAERVLQLAAAAGLFDAYAHEALAHANVMDASLPPECRRRRTSASTSAAAGPLDVYRRRCGQNISLWLVGRRARSG